MNVRKLQREINCLTRKLNSRTLWQWQIDDINKEIERLSKRIGWNVYNPFDNKFQPAVLVDVDGEIKYIPMNKAFELGVFNYRYDVSNM